MRVHASAHVGLLTAVLIYPSVAAAAAQPMRPSGDWVLYSSDTQCLAGRTYGNGDPVTLGIRQTLVGDSYELIVGQKGQPPETVLENWGNLKFEKASTPRLFLHTGSKANGTDIYQLRITADQMKEMQTAPAVTMSMRDGPTISLALDGMSDVLSELANCVVSLKSRWNIAEGGSASFKTHARGDLRSIFTADDYPLQAMASLQGGRVQFLLMIDETGGVAGCDVVLSSGNPLLDGMGCQIIRKRARFTPALDSHGKAVRDFVVTPPIIWGIGGS